MLLHVSALACRRTFKPTGAVGADIKCHGYLEGYYAAANETFYYRASDAPTEPLGVVADAPPYDHAQLEQAHTALLEAISPVLHKAGVAPSSLPPMHQMVVGVWSRPGVIKNDTGYTAPTKVCAPRPVPRFPSATAAPSPRVSNLLPFARVLRAHELCGSSDMRITGRSIGPPPSQAALPPRVASLI